MIRSVKQWNRLIAVAADGQSVTVELRIQKPNTPLWTKQEVIPTSLEALQIAFEHVGDTWSQLKKEESGPTFDAVRVAIIPTAETVIIIRWDVHHVEGSPYLINDELEVACIAFTGFDVQLIIEHAF